MNKSSPLASTAIAAVEAAPWAIRVISMSGGVACVSCPDQAQTTIAFIKREVALQNPICLVQCQSLVLPVDMTDSSDASPDSCATTPLADADTLASIGLGDGASLELLMQELAMAAHEQKLFDTIAQGGAEIDLRPREGAHWSPLLDPTSHASDGADPDAHLLRYWGRPAPVWKLDHRSATVISWALLQQVHENSAFTDPFHFC
jgi:hypothetical protein